MRRGGGKASRNKQRPWQSLCTSLNAMRYINIKWLILCCFMPCNTVRQYDTEDAGYSARDVPLYRRFAWSHKQRPKKQWHGGKGILERNPSFRTMLSTVKTRIIICRGRLRTHRPSKMLPIVIQLRSC